MTEAELNRRICRLYLSGMTTKEVASRLRIPIGHVWHVAVRDKEAGEWAIRGERARQEIRACDDIDRKWPMPDVIDALQLPTRARTGLVSYYDDQKAMRLSLRELMDFVVPEKPIPDRQFGCTNVTRLRNVGRLGFWAILERLSTLDLGEKAKVEWKRKLELLRRYGRKKDLPAWVWKSHERNPNAA